MRVAVIMQNDMPITVCAAGVLTTVLRMERQRLERDGWVFDARGTMGVREGYPRVYLHVRYFDVVGA